MSKLDVRIVIVSAIILLLVFYGNPGFARLDLIINQGPKNIVLFYDDFPTRGDPNFQITNQTVLPLIAYSDSSGVLKDWFFDGFVFYSYYLYAWPDSFPSKQYVTSWGDYLFNGSAVSNNCIFCVWILSVFSLFL